MSELNLKKNEVIKGWAKYYLTAEVNSGFERLTAPAFSYGMSAILAKLYKEDEEEYKKALQRHLMFYNSEATWGSVIFGMTCALEEERAIMLQEGAGSEEEHPALLADKARCGEVVYLFQEQGGRDGQHLFFVVAGNDDP